MSIRMTAFALLGALSLSCTHNPRSSLPNDEPEFDEVVRTWIRAGDDLEECVSLIEARGFECEAAADGQDSRCERSRVINLRPYVRQVHIVVMSGQDKAVESIKTNIALSRRRQ